MQGKVIQVSTSPGGVPNYPVLEGHLDTEGFAGDGWNNRKRHGGANQAVLLLASEVIEELRALGYPVFPGALGENITTESVDFAHLRAGQRFRLGEAIIELTKIRTPCSTLDTYGPGIQRCIYDLRVKQADPTSPVWAKSGFYARVLRAGVVKAHDPITLLSFDPPELGLTAQAAASTPEPS